MFRSYIISLFLEVWRGHFSISVGFGQTFFPLIQDSLCTDTWKKDVKPRDIEDAVNNAAPGKLKVISVYEVMSFLHNTCKRVSH